MRIGWKHTPETIEKNRLAHLGKHNKLHNEVIKKIKFGGKPFG